MIEIIVPKLFGPSSGLHICGLLIYRIRGKTYRKGYVWQNNVRNEAIEIGTIAVGIGVVENPMVGAGIR